MSIIQLENVSYSYKIYEDDGTAKRVVGVKDINFEINQGEFLSVVGHNGSGKSTFAKLLNGLFLPQVGKVTVLDMDTKDKQSIFEVRKNVGMVFQNPDNQMVASIIEEDVAFGPENLGIPQKEIAERVYWALEKVGMCEHAKRTPSKLSGGQKQRVAIAGALAIKPQVLVLDESTAMLDPQGRKEVLAVAHNLNKEQGMTVVLITHFMEEVLSSDRVAVFSHGEIVASGTPMEIFNQRELVESVGLKIPRTLELAQKLRQNGFDVNSDETNATILGEEVCRLLQKS